MPRWPRPDERFRRAHAKVARAVDRLGATVAEAGPLEAGVRRPDIGHAILLGVPTIRFPATIAALTGANPAIVSHEA